MKKLLIALLLCGGFAVSAFGQGAPPWTITEVDGSPRVSSPTLIKVTNGTLSCTGKTCTITIGTGSGNVTAAGTLTANLPVIGAGGTAVAVGTRSGNTTAFVTTTGALTAGRCVEIDASGNFIQSAAACGGAGATIDIGTSAIINGTAGRVLYETAGNVAGEITGATSDGTTLTLVAPVLGAATATSITASAAGLNFSGTNTTDAASLQLMLLRGNRATVTSNDEIYMSFSLANAAAAQKEVGRITTAIFPNTAGAEGGRIDFSVADSGTLAKRVQLSPADLSPSNDNAVALGTNGTLQWSDLFLGSGGVISFDNSDVVLTHSAGILTMGTGELRITTVGTNAASVPTLASSSTLSNKTLATGTIFAGYSDIAEIAAPANPSAGSIRLFADSGTGDLTCLNSAGGDCLPVGSSGITVGTTTVTSGTATRLFYETAGNVVGQISGATSDGTNVTFGSGNLLATSPIFTTDITTPIVKSAAGVALALNATAPAAANGASQVGVAVNVLASNAVASLDTAGAAKGGDVNVTAGNAARLTSGNANGGDVVFTSGAGIGTGTKGSFIFNPDTNITVIKSGSYIALDLNSGVGVTISGGTLLVNNSTATLASTALLRWNAGDLNLRRAAAANLAFGAADAASPVAQTLSFQGATGTDASGATATIRGSLGTSVGVPGRVHVAGGAMIPGTGTTTQTAVDRHIVGATKVLTNNSAIALVNATAAAGASVGILISYGIEVWDGTDMQVDVGKVACTLNNKAGAFTQNTCTAFGAVNSPEAGTLTVTWAISAANPGVISVNANSSLTPSTGYPRIVYSVENLTNQAIAVQ